MNQTCRRLHPQRLQRGVSLIITLIMLVVIGLTAASSMKLAISGEGVVNNLREEAQAQQYAEVALRYCEGEMTRASAARPVAALQDGALPAAVALSATTWNTTATWTGGAKTAVTIPNTEVYNNVDSTLRDTEITVLPECRVERVILGAPPAGVTIYLITARGFSPGYAANADGTTRRGAVVWLQSLLTVS